MDSNLNKLCRTCLFQNKDFISIYDEEKSNDFDCVYLLGMLTNSMPNRSDGLPGQVCLTCFQEIKCINSFKLKCINSESVLRKMLLQDEDEIMPPNDKSLNQINNIEIKSEEPCCSYEENESNQKVFPETVETQEQVFEVIVKEEPALNELRLEPGYESAEESELCERVDQTDEDEDEEELDCKEENSDQHDRTKELDDCNETNGKCQSVLQCPNCNKVFKHLERLKKHLMNHKFCKGNFIYTCSLCNKQFNRQYSLQRHILVSHKQTMTKEILTQSTEAKTSQIEYVEKQIEESLKTLRQCNMCKEVFKDNVELEEHKKNHQHKLYPCDLCNKTFKSSFNRKIHKMNHEKIRPFKCEQCDKSFVRNSCLNRHSKIHMAARPFTCEVCDKGFPYLYALKTHQRTHNEERPFSCNICSMRFKLASTLKDHQRTHTGEKPFACEICSRKLSSKANYKIHMKSHEQNNEEITPDPSIESNEVLVKAEA